MSDELRAVLMAMLRHASDEQRRILHRRVDNLCRASDENDRSNFVVEVMRDLPYPDFDGLLKTFFKEATQKV